MKSLIQKVILILLVTGFCSMFAYADTYNLSTYHTSSKGNYSLLRLPPLGASLNSSCDIGEFYTNPNGELQYCDDDGSGNNTGIWGPVPGIWRQLGDNIFLTDYTNSSIKIGIGTTTPQAPFHIRSDKNIVMPSISYGGSETAGDILLVASDPTLTLVGENDSVGESQILFPEIDTSGNFTNLWAFGRTTTIGSSRFFLSFMQTGGYTDNPANQMINWVPGKMGIGPFGGYPTPKTPQTQLHLLDDDGSTNLRLEESSGAVGTHSIWEFQAVDQESGPTQIHNALKIYGGNEGSLQYRIMIQKDGNIGVAKTSPINSALDISDNGSLKLESSSPSLEMNYPVTTASAKFILNNNLFKMQMKPNSGSSFSDHLIFNLANRYVGIGNNFTPTYPLHIAGNSVDQILALEHSQPYLELQDTDNLDWQLTTGFAGAGENRLALRNNFGGSFGNVITVHDDAGITRVGIGVDSPDSNKALQLYTGAYIRSDTGDICSGSGNCLDAHFVSDMRLKRDIQPLTGALDKINALRVVTFDWKDPEKYGKSQQIGFIAQEVEKIFPQWVITKKDGYKALDIYGFEGLVVEGLRELDTKITDNFSSLNTLADHLQIKMNENIQTFEKENLLFEELSSKLK